MAPGPTATARWKWDPNLGISTSQIPFDFLLLSYLSKGIKSDVIMGNVPQVTLGSDMDYCQRLIITQGEDGCYCQ